MVVDGACLPDFPADGEQLEKRSFLDEIAGVMLAVPIEIGLEGIWVDRIVAKDLANFGNVGEISFG
jgi:hypothetical protein